MGNSTPSVLSGASGRFTLVVSGMFCLLLIAGCANTIYPISTGSHAPIDPANKEKRYRYVVWSNHPAMGNALSAWLQRGGHTIVERARIQEVLSEQKVRLTHSADEDADVLRVGRIVGADRVVFMEATIRPEAYSTAYAGNSFGRFDASYDTGTLYHLSVAIRAVSVETGEIRWQGSAYYPTAVSSPEQGILQLAGNAVGRALCRVDDGYKWSESDGCKESE